MSPSWSGKRGVGFTLLKPEGFERGDVGLNPLGGGDQALAVPHLKAIGETWAWGPLEDKDDARSGLLLERAERRRYSPLERAGRHGLHSLLGRTEGSGLDPVLETEGKRGIGSLVGQEKGHGTAPLLEGTGRQGFGPPPGVGKRGLGTDSSRARNGDCAWPSPGAGGETWAWATPEMKKNAWA